ncbi:unnamed protein product [Protopolystoma xenopodis]|uniref:Uncharacterized protein n=1 Tax=Protopolystoma xenopodis TaxID=117903 RepID=A0A448WLW4_9PLAT|nr:unnamed protein product [Protopolystoma xenopodis]
MRYANVMRHNKVDQEPASTCCFATLQPRLSNYEPSKVGVNASSQCSHAGHNQEGRGRGERTGYVGQRASEDTTMHPDALELYYGNGNLVHSNVIFLSSYKPYVWRPGRWARIDITAEDTTTRCTRSLHFGTATRIWQNGALTFTDLSWAKRSQNACANIGDVQLSGGLWQKCPSLRARLLRNEETVKPNATVQLARETLEGEIQVAFAAGSSRSEPACWYTHSLSKIIFYKRTGYRLLPGREKESKGRIQANISGLSGGSILLNQMMVPRKFPLG